MRCSDLRSATYVIPSFSDLQMNINAFVTTASVLSKSLSAGGIDFVL